MKITDRFSGGVFQLVSCSHCSLIYLDPRPGVSELGDYYPDGYEAYHYSTTQQISSAEQWHARRMWNMQMDYVEKYLSNRGRLLDVGCATGEFMNIARDRGWQTLGIELIDKAAQVARGKYGLEVITGTLETASLNANQFDVITLWDVLEHLSSPKAALQCCYQLLVDKGLLIFSIPNLSSFDRYLFGPAWIGWDPPRHFNLFTDDTLRCLFAQTGFTLIDRRCILGGKGTFFLSLERVLDRGLGKIALKFYPLISALLWPYRQISYYLRRGPIITYVARKI
jgi:spore maturation protein CgeB